MIEKLRNKITELLDLTIIIDENKSLPLSIKYEFMSKIHKVIESLNEQINIIRYSKNRKKGIAT